MKDTRKNILKRYTQGKCSRSEYFSVHKIFHEGSSDILHSSMREHWEGSKDNQALNMRMTKLLLELSKKAGERQRSIGVSVLLSYQRIAAILLIPLLLVSLWVFYKPAAQLELSTATLVAPLGGRTQFVLPDGTTGWLNSGSTLYFQTDFKKRKVELMGEAYFEVTHRNNENFIVQTSDLSVEVLGTKFNVSAYDDDLETTVALSEGKVKISNDNASISEILQPNEQFKLDKSKSRGTISTSNSVDFSSWKDGFLKFRNETFSSVAKKIERWYNIEIEIPDQQLLDYRYRGAFDNERLEEVLRLISLTTPLTYTVMDRTKNEHGNYQKQKVIIRTKK